MKKLVREAVAITKELGQVVFVGAVAVYLHTKSGRESRDLDLAMASELTFDQLLERGYKPYRDDKWSSPRGFRVDFFTRDVSGISVSTIIGTAKDVQVDRKGTTIKIMSLESLIVAKHRAARPSRPQDVDDLAQIAREKYDGIDWTAVGTLSRSQIEFDNIKVAMQTLRATGRI